ncbi:MAG: copper chaperone PCu(A)C [Gammaproteobacteria bacterium]
MMRSQYLIAAAACLAAQAVGAASIGVTGAWARATVPGQSVGGAYMQIRTDADARLIGASSLVASRVEVHEMKMDGDVMRMRELKVLDLPKGKTVSLAPGGLHLMLMNLKKPIAAGDVVPVTLVVESGGKRQPIEVKAEVRPMGGGGLPHPHR